MLPHIEGIFNIFFIKTAIICHNTIIAVYRRSYSLISFIPGILKLQDIAYFTLQAITDLRQSMKVYPPYFILTVIIQLCSL